MDTVEKKDYETALTRLKEIEKEISDSSISLEDCMERLDEGVGLAKVCLGSIRENLDGEKILSAEPDAIDAG